MKALIAAIKTVLGADSTLTAIVPANDITISHNPETANYPCITLEVEDGDSEGKPKSVGVDEMILSFFSQINNEQTWDIHDLVKGLLHDEPHSISNGSVKIHSIQLKSKKSKGFSERFRTWNVETMYKILYSEV